MDEYEPDTDIDDDVDTQSGGPKVLLVAVVLVGFLGCAGVLGGGAAVWYVNMNEGQSTTGLEEVLAETDGQAEEVPGEVTSDAIEGQDAANMPPEAGDPPTPEAPEQEGAVASMEEAAVDEVTEAPSASTQKRTTEPAPTSTPERRSSAPAAESAPASRRASKPAPAPASAAVHEDAVAEVGTEYANVPVIGEVCADLVAIEPAAMMGAVKPDVISCLETRFVTTHVNTEREKVSLLLMVDAYSKDDLLRWERLVERHLNEVSQADPDLCFKFSLYLSKLGTHRASDVIKWADMALENKFFWTGELHTSRVYSLHKVRSNVALALWKVAVETRAADPTEANQEAADAARLAAKISAREWYDYAESAGKDAMPALALCKSAATNDAYCGN